MEQKRSKVISAEIIKGKDGKPVQNDKRHYFHAIAMENGDKGIYASIKDIQTYFVAGREMEYEIGEVPKESDPTKTFIKIKPFYQKTQPLNQGTVDHKPKPTYSLTDIAVASQRRAVEAWLGNGIGREDIQSFSKEMSQYLIDLIDELNRTEI